jgi:hypothetical protein
VYKPINNYKSKCVIIKVTGDGDVMQEWDKCYHVGEMIKEKKYYCM